MLCVLLRLFCCPCVAVRAAASFLLPSVAVHAAASLLLPKCCCACCCLCCCCVCTAAAAAAACVHPFPQLTHSLPAGFPIPCPTGSKHHIRLLLTCSPPPSHRSQQIFNIFTSVFGATARAARLRYVVSSWGFFCNGGTGCGAVAINATLGYQGTASKADMLAVAAYFDCGLGSSPAQDMQVGDMCVWGEQGRAIACHCCLLPCQVLPACCCAPHLAQHNYQASACHLPISCVMLTCTPAALLPRS